MQGIFILPTFTRMIVFPCCKINLGLHITERRSDGYHELDTIFYPLPFYDALECIPAHQLSFKSAGLPIPGNPEQNLVLKAYHLLKADFPYLPAFEIFLYKHIPMGGGLGGGSGNATAMLQLINEQYKLQLSVQQLADYALQLGSDCPFFLYNCACFGQGRGELLKPIELDLSNYRFVLILPGLAVPTAWAFTQIKPQKPALSCEQIIQQPISTWKDFLKNDFETAVFATYPQLAFLKNKLYEAGAIYSAMSGSGSTLYGLFEKKGFDQVQEYLDQNLNIEGCATYII